MPSLGHMFCRIFIKSWVATKFNPSISIEKARKGLEDLTKFAHLPSNTQVEQVTFNAISAEWVCGRVSHEDRAILYLHGGGYNMCSPNTHREMVACIAKICGVKVLVPDYRLAPEHQFPCALEDAILAYRWLIDRGFTGGQIAIAGDSAGAGLSIATAISLRDAGNPLPASIACISPWIDLAMTGDSIKTNSKVDPMLNEAWLKTMATNYVGNEDLRSPLASPLYADLSGLPPLLIHVGSDEILFDDSIRIAKKAENAEVSVTLKVYDHLWHVFHLNARLMPEAKSALEDFGSFINEHYAN